jgi:hypothetical protein
MRESYLYMNDSNRNYRLNLKYDYASWIDNILNNHHYTDQQWKGYIITFMYNHIPGSIERQFSVMEGEIGRLYATLVRHIVRDPRSPSQRKKLPILHAFPDQTEDVTINDGLHYHGIILIRSGTRLQVPLDEYINVKRNYRHLVKFGGPLRRIHIGPVDDETSQNAASYAFKAIEWRIPDSNRMLILPKALSELPSIGPNRADAQRAHGRQH